ncbi:hypothetical protein CYMTET_14191 [Cymbomonas tetramitiformis]|uniref:DUF659 domain-containing protein n=1 Tax=Cymbomonas tetramitiformis TaxID=36881 RepID=A0AAE0GGZ3_9CHLO|nr:hypothetical protein CYMTET_14191 [Cymbomonas tetramitiformis]
MSYLEYLSTVLSPEDQEDVLRTFDTVEDSSDEELPAGDDVGEGDSDDDGELDLAEPEIADSRLAFECPTGFSVIEKPAALISSVQGLKDLFIAMLWKEEGWELGKERERVEQDVKHMRGPVERFGSTIVSDGATDGNRRPIINLVDVSPEFVEFVFAKDCTGHTKNAQYIADLVTDYIFSLPDPRKVVQVLMDNATRASWPLIEEKCPWVVVGPCEPHVSSLEEGDIMKLPFFKETSRQVQVVRKFILNHQKPLAVFKELATGMLHTPGGTRMGTHYYCFRNFAKQKEAVSSSMGSTAVSDYVRANRSQRATPESPTLMESFTEARDYAIDCDLYARVELCLRVLAPVIEISASADFWFMYGQGLKELQLVGMRATAQTSGAGASERGHKLMNVIEDKTRNRLKWDNVESLMYVAHNVMNLRKRRKVTYEGHHTPWSEAAEENDGWQDAWREENAAEEARAAELREESIRRAAIRSSQLTLSASSRIPPVYDVQVESDSVDTDSVSTRSRRLVRRPVVFS